MSAIFCNRSFSDLNGKTRYNQNHLRILQRVNVLGYLCANVTRSVFKLFSKNFPLSLFTVFFLCCVKLFCLRSLFKTLIQNFISYSEDFWKECSVHFRKRPFADFFKIGVFKIFAIFTGFTQHKRKSVNRDRGKFLFIEHLWWLPLPFIKTFFKLPEAYLGSFEISIMKVLAVNSFWKELSYKCLTGSYIYLSPTLL